MMMIVFHILATIYILLLIYSEWSDYLFVVHEDWKEVVWPILTTVVLLYVVIDSWVPASCLLV